MITRIEIDDIRASFEPKIAHPLVMGQIVSALYPEGSDDENFFGTLVPRVIRQEAIQWDDLPLISAIGPEIVHVEDASNRASAILTAAKKTRGRHLLFIHSDADARTARKALRGRAEPGLEPVGVLA